MPVYTFHNIKTGEEWDDVMSYTERTDFLKNNPHIEHIPKAMNVGDSVRLGIKKPDNSMREVLQKVKGAHPLSTVDPGNKTEI